MRASKREREREKRREEKRREEKRREEKRERKGGGGAWCVCWVFMAVTSVSGEHVYGARDCLLD